MSFEEEGIEQVKIQLRRLGDLPSVLSEEMFEMAKEVAKKAQDMAPIEYGGLKDAIQVRRTGAQGAGGRFVKGFSNYEVYVNNNAEAIGRPTVDNVGQYAWFVHQYMGYGSTPGATLKNGKSFMPSEESVAAGEAVGVEAGGRFMERAEEAMRQRVYSELQKVALKWF